MWCRTCHKVRPAEVGYERVLEWYRGVSLVPGIELEVPTGVSGQDRGQGCRGGMKTEEGSCLCTGRLPTDGVGSWSDEDSQGLLVHRNTSVGLSFGGGRRGWNLVEEGVSRETLQLKNNEIEKQEVEEVSS